MKQVQSLHRVAVFVAILSMSVTSAVFAGGFLDGLWFKLKLSVKGEEMNSASNEVTKTTITVPVYANFVGSSNHLYQIHFWTEGNSGWTNQYTAGYFGVGTNDFFFPDTSVTFYGTDGSYLHTYHTVFISAKLNKTGTVESATYNGVGEINFGIVTDGSTTNFVFGGDTVVGSTVESNKLPFTP